jgi:hypothetical protein
MPLIGKSFINSNSEERKRRERNNITDVFGIRSKSSSKKREKVKEDKSKGKSKIKDTPKEGDTTPNILEQ